MIFDMPWQDFVFSSGNILFTVALIPSILSKTDKPAFYTSLSTSIVGTIFTLTFASLEMWMSVLGSSLLALSWWVLAVQRYIMNRNDQATSDATHS